MDNNQTKAVMRLEKALDACNKAGLQGGVYEGSFCIWPIASKSPHEIEDSREENFYAAIEGICKGKILFSKMHLDGGNGW